jgi:hypothetical protein
LGSSRICDCRVRLEHNLAGPLAVLVSPEDGACDSGPECHLTDTSPPHTFVRVSVCVRRGALLPGAFSFFGLHTSEPCDVVGSTTTFRYELEP